MGLLRNSIFIILVLVSGLEHLVAPMTAAGDERGLDGTVVCRLFTRDVAHVANRVHAALFMRIGPDGRIYGEDRLEPLLWRNSRYLLNGEQADRAWGAVQELLRADLSEIDSIWQRAVLQRDLWLVASWLAAHDKDASPKLLGPLAATLRRLALSKVEIQRLGDNYEMAVASGQFAAAFDPSRPQRAFLPADLFQSEGPWVCIGRTDGRTAPTHLGVPHHLLRHANGHPFTNSVFLVFLRMPAGREAGEKFVKTLSRQKKPMFLVTEREDGRRVSTANRELPNLPVGAELALVRRAMLISNEGDIVASPLTESVQLRVTTSASIPEADGGGLSGDDPRAAAFEFELRRADLFGNLAGGLRDGSLQRDFTTGVYESLVDEFEVDRQPPEGYPLQPFHTAPQLRRETCFGCHAVSNLYGTRSFQRAWLQDEVLDDDSSPLFPVAVMSPRAVARIAVEWKTSQPEWTRLRKLAFP